MLIGALHYLLGSEDRLVVRYSIISIADVCRFPGVADSSPRSRFRLPFCLQRWRRTGLARHFGLSIWAGFKSVDWLQAWTRSRAGERGRWINFGAHPLPAASRWRHPCSRPGIHHNGAVAPCAGSSGDTFRCMVAPPRRSFTILRQDNKNTSFAYFSSNRQQGRLAPQCRPRR
jgi:hypothetical protein